MMSPGSATPSTYRAHDTASLVGYLASIAPVKEVLGGEPGDWRVEEVGDGNLNLVFIVRGGSGAVAVKQALPYVRLVGESWPLPLSRAWYEHMALVRQRGLVGDLVPKVLHFEPDLALIVMQYLTPHIIMRYGMIDAVRYPRFAGDIATYMANMLFFTSDLGQSAADKKTMLGDFAGNSALCKITEDLIFTEPYMVADNNRWTSPQLDAIAADFRQDIDLKIAISRLKLKFLSSAQALLHGDLHTGSVMVTREETRIIDPEFAFVGPMGFDIGAVIGNLLINYFSHAGHEKSPGNRDAYRQWVLETVVEVWEKFSEKFLDLWRSGKGHGDAYPAALFGDAAAQSRLQAERQTYMAALFQDTLGFAAAKMIRRVLGLAHNADLETIADPDRRAPCEKMVLRLARRLMVETSDFTSIAAVTVAAEQMYKTHLR